MNSALQRLMVGAAVAVTIFASPRQCHAALASGWELLETTEALAVGGIQWKGVPLGSFDFGGQVGTRPVGTADSVIRRELISVGFDDTEVHHLVVEALQWVSLSPFDAGAGMDVHYLTLSSPTPGGRLHTFIGWDGQGIGPVCDHSLEVEFSVRKGALDGPIVRFGATRLGMIDMGWSAQTPSGALALSGLNESFWVAGDTHFGLGAGDIQTWTHRYAVPEPRAISIVAALALASWGIGRRIRRNATLDRG